MGGSVRSAARTAALACALVAVTALLGLATQLFRVNALARVAGQPVVLVASAVAIGGLVATRGSRRLLWPFVPALVAIGWALRESIRLRSELGSPLANVDEYGRAVADLSAESYAPLVLGSAIAGAFGVIAALLEHGRAPNRRGLGLAAVALAVVSGLRLAVVEWNVFDVAVLVAFAGGAVVMTHAQRFPPMLAAITGVAAVDLAGYLLTTRLGLGAAGTYALDAPMLERVLAATVSDEHRRLLVFAFDVAILGSLGLRVRTIDWRWASCAGVLVLVGLTPFEWLRLRGLFASLEPRVLSEGAGVVHGDEPASVLVERGRPGVGPMLFVGANAPELGAFAPLLGTRDAKTVSLEVVRTLSVTDRDEHVPFGAVAFRWTGDSLSVRPFETDGDILVRTRAKLGQDLVEVDKTSASFYALEKTLGPAASRQRAVLFVPPDTKLVRVERFLDVIGALRFEKVTVSVDTAVFDRL